MKKLLCLLCMTAVITSMTACGKQTETSTANNAETKTSAEVIEETSDSDTETVSETESKAAEDEIIKEENNEIENADSEGITIGTEAMCQTNSAEERKYIQGNLFDESAIDTEYNEEEAETVEELAQTVVDSMASGNVHAFSDALIRYSDIDMTYYGGFGNRPSAEEFFPILEDELQYLSDDFDGTSKYIVTDVQVAGADDVFWKFISSDSEMMQEIDESYDYDMSEIYTFDKAYRITYDVHDEVNPDNEETGVFVYVARTTEGEWKFEVMFNFLYEEYEGLKGMNEE